MSDPNKSALTPHPCYLTPTLERLGTWIYATGASNCPPGVPFCVIINPNLLLPDGGPLR